MLRVNCWDFKKCGREPGGRKVAELGVCPAAVEKRTSGINQGMNGGRACWAIAGTFCDGKIQGSFASKLGDCLKCEFHRRVRMEQGVDYESIDHILSLLK